ncbi:hypothetical protein VNO78_14062 [Psophocarpus tetragonolobus]|uniref:14-3-3 domain-containing protein n=1 Tax=Psophocarpus tetragonolobus TaxID=3891 RepID=A0AAN9XQU9_PSOTE
MAIIKEYKGKIEAKLDKIFDDILNLLDSNLIPSATSPESNVFYLKMNTTKSELSNVINVNFCARISNYGLNFLAPVERKGLVGHVDDEYWSERRDGEATKESDVYGLRVVLLQLLSGKGCEGGLLVKWIFPLIRETNFNELFYPRLVIPSDMKPLIRLAKVASTCLSESVSQDVVLGALWHSWTYVANSGNHAETEGTGQRIVSVSISSGGMLIFAMKLGLVSDAILEKGVLYGIEIILT